MSEDERSDFKKLDTNGDGKLDLNELKGWEAGHFHTHETMQKLFELADKDNDMHITHEEFHAAREHISSSDALYHLTEWIEHHEL